MFGFIRMTTHPEPRECTDRSGILRMLAAIAVPAIAVLVLALTFGADCSDGDGPDAEGNLVIEGDTYIDTSQYEDVDDMKTVTFKGNIGSIGENAFAYCDSLTSVTFHGDVGSIGVQAFYSCDSLTSVTFHGNVDSIGERAFLNDPSLTHVTVGGDVGSIGEHAFENCSSLENVTVGGDVGSIGAKAFYYSGHGYDNPGPPR